MFLSLQHLAALLITQQVIGQIKEAMVDTTQQFCFKHKPHIHPW
jgi:hypothetical protein